MAETDASLAATIRQLMARKDASRLLYVAVELGLAELLGDGSHDSAALAAAAGADPDALRRVLRGLAQLGVVAQDEDGHFTLTPLGACLRADAPDSQRAYVRWNGHPLWLQMWAHLLDTVHTGRAAFEHAFGTDLFAYLAAHPDVAAAFHGGMAAVTAGAEDAILAGYDFAPLATLVDVGGGTGALLAAILRAYPQARGQILDRPDVRAEAEATIAAAGLGARCAFVAGDFFAAVPAGADAYILKAILHDWDDARSLAILRACRRAIPPHGRLLVIDQLLPMGAAATYETIMLDINMLAVLGSRQRTEGEHRALFEQAGFRLARVVPLASGDSLVEGVPA
ncbi:MAG: methyltransferase [Thermomicrobiales bacterium]